MDRDELLTKRLLVANEALLEAYGNLDPKDPEYWQKLKTLSALHEKVIRDVELELNDQHKEAELDLESERNAIEMQKINEATRANRKGEKLEISKQAVLVGTTLFSGLTGLWMFKRSTRKEADEALLTQTDQTVVKSGLSNIFRFGRKNEL